MKVQERVVSLFWAVLAGLVAFESVRMGLGTARAPGMGFMPFCAAVILGGLSIAQLATTFGQSSDRAGEPPFSRSTLLKVVPAMAALLAYALALEKVGYLIGTFALMLFLFWLARPARGWLPLLLAAVLTTALSHLVFQVFLDTQFPKGPFGF